MGFSLLTFLFMLTITVTVILILIYTMNSEDKLSEINNNLGLSSSSGKPYELSVSQGEVNGKNTLYKYGYNGSVGTLEETIWTVGGNITWLTDASILSVTSDSGDDALGGTGARRIKIFGLDSNYSEITEDIDLNGLAPVNTNNSFLRVFRSFVFDSGTGGVNVGTISIKDDNNVTLAEITETEGQTQMAVYTVPAGKKLYVDNINFTSANTQGNRLTTIKLRTREEGTNTWRVKFINNLESGQFNADFKYPLVYNEKTDIECRGFNSSDTSLVSATFQGVLIDT